MIERCCGRVVWYAVLILLTLLPPLIGWIRTKRKCVGRTMCPVCGYDLCATPTRCPECGTPRSSAEHMIHLREYTVWDFEVVCQVHDRARPQELAAGGVNPQAFRPMAEVAGRDEFFVSATLLACVDDVVAGFVSWNGGYITWLYVDPGFQRLGVGRRLLDEALRHIGKEAWTNMIAGNEAALALYTQAGLQVVLTRPGECEGHPCRSMRLALPTSLMSDPAVRRS